MVFKNLGVLVLWLKVASALEGLRFGKIELSSDDTTQDCKIIKIFSVVLQYTYSIYTIYIQYTSCMCWQL